MEIQSYTKTKEKSNVEQEKFTDDFLTTYDKLAIDRTRRDKYLTLTLSVPNYKRLSYISFAMACRLLDLMREKGIDMVDIIYIEDRDEFYDCCETVVNEAIDSQIIKGDRVKGIDSKRKLFHNLERYYRKLIRGNEENALIR